MYRAGIEGILGIRREGAALVLRPRVPSSWPGFEATIRHGTSDYTITVRRDATAAGAMRATCDGGSLAASGDAYFLPLDGRRHDVVVLI